MMLKQIDIPSGFYDDEVVCFIAERYHITTEELVQRFLAQNDAASENGRWAFRLEENEMAILRDLLLWIQKMK